jgi:hypothetical protein
LVDEQVHADEVVELAAALLTSRPPKTLGLPVLLRLLRYDASREWATNALKTEFEAREFDLDLLARLVVDAATSDFAREFLSERFGKTELPASFWIGILRGDLDDAPWDTADHALEQLAEYPLTTLPAEFLLEALANDDWGYTVADWLENAAALPPGIDAERVKGLVFDPDTREVAFTLLGNQKLFPADVIGVPFLLALARRADPSLHKWAHDYLLEHVAPTAFADDGDPMAAAARLFGLATGAREPEALRAFAQRYLTVHHPKVGRSEARSLGVTAGLPREAFSAALVWPTLWDDRPDVRKFGVSLARAELARWNEPHRVYELADAPAKEVRNVAYDALTQAGERNADPDLALSPDQLDPALVFSMTESTVGTTRDVAMTLIRKHYGRLGGAERLGWLMQSADREVRMYAVRLLWEKHRPTPIPDDWKPAGKHRDPPQPFGDGPALRDLLRRLLFAIPPARGGEKGARKVGRRLPANVAKRRMVEVVRDFAIEDRAFADLAAPVLAEFTGSLAKGEWQTCLSALMTLRRVHGLQIEGLV